MICDLMGMHAHMGSAGLILLLVSAALFLAVAKSGKMLAFALLSQAQRRCVRLLFHYLLLYCCEYANFFLILAQECEKF
jgi:hypothetical protein